MMRTVAHFLPFAALAGGILILLMPRLLNCCRGLSHLGWCDRAQQHLSLHPLRATEAVTAAPRLALAAVDRVRGEEERPTEKRPQIRSACHHPVHGGDQAMAQPTSSSLTSSH